MKFCSYTNVVSPHQLPLAREIVACIGAANYRYVYTTPLMQGRRGMGWCEEKEEWILPEWENHVKAREMLENADVLMSGVRDFDLFEVRAAKGLTTIYSSERWFKPPRGAFRLMSPKYFNMARRLVRLLRYSDRFFCYPIGIHAARDMARLCGLMDADLRCLIRAPKLAFENKPGGKIFCGAENAGCIGKKYCLDKMRMWGYFVDRSQSLIASEVRESPLTTNDQRPTVTKVLWVGRLLKLKRVDAIVHAVGELAKRIPITLDIYGHGPEEAHLKRQASAYGNTIRFHPSVPIADVRSLMRSHDVYVFGSNGFDGWGAVVSEALEEGMAVVGTFESGASATMLPTDCLFHAGDWRGLVRLLERPILRRDIGEWTATSAAIMLVHEFAHAMPQRSVAWRKEGKS